MRSIAILGGGIAGLAAAHRLFELASKQRLEIDVALYERGAAVGGCVRTLRESGLVMELGADSLLIDKPPARQLLVELGLEDSIVDVCPQFKGARIVRAGRLRRLPSAFRLFAPTSLPALMRSGIFSPLGMARAAMEPFVPARKHDADESVACFVSRRFGREVLERLAQPLVGGLYSADPKRLSMRATLPQFLDLERSNGSVLRGMRSRIPREPRLVSLREGLQTLIDALQTRIGAGVRTGNEAVGLQRNDAGWTIAFAGGNTAHADAVICALPAYASAALLRGHDERLAWLLENIRYNSIATVNLAYDASAAAALPRSTGFIVPHAEGRCVTAATFSTQKYPNRAPRDTALVRAFIGGALAPELLECDDDELESMARREFAELTQIAATPRRVAVARWERLLPEYGVGHVELVREIERRIAQLHGLALAGSAYHGVGIPDCAQTGRTGAESVFGYICA